MTTTPTMAEIMAQLEGLKMNGDISVLDDEDVQVADAADAEAAELDLDEEDAHSEPEDDPLDLTVKEDGPEIDPDYDRNSDLVSEQSEIEGDDLEAGEEAEANGDQEEEEEEAIKLDLGTETAEEEDDDIDFEVDEEGDIEQQLLGQFEEDAADKESAAEPSPYADISIEQEALAADAEEEALAADAEQEALVADAEQEAPAANAEPAAALSSAAEPSRYVDISLDQEASTTDASATYSELPELPDMSEISTIELPTARSAPLWDEPILPETDASSISIEANNDSTVASDASLASVIQEAEESKASVIQEAEESKELKQETSQIETEIQQAKTEFEERKEEIEEKKEEVKEEILHEKEDIEDKKSEIAAAIQEIALLEETLPGVEAKDEIVEAKTEEIAELQADIAKDQAEIAELQRQLEQVSAQPAVAAAVVAAVAAVPEAAKLSEMFVRKSAEEVADYDRAQVLKLAVAQTLESGESAESIAKLFNAELGSNAVYVPYIQSMEHMDRFWASLDALQPAQVKQLTRLNLRREQSQLHRQLEQVRGPRATVEQFDVRLKAYTNSLIRIPLHSNLDVRKPRLQRTPRSSTLNVRQPQLPQARFPSWVE